MSSLNQKPSVPLLHIDTQITSPSHGLRGGPVSAPISTGSVLVPIPLTPLEVQGQTSPSTHLAKLASSHNTFHAEDESRKLLSLLLDQLQNRPKPPSIFEQFGSQSNDIGRSSIGRILEAVKGSSRLQQDGFHALPSGHGDSDDEDSNTHTFSTDTTFELMVQLMEVLLFSASQGWKIFEARSPYF